MGLLPSANYILNWLDPTYSMHINDVPEWVPYFINRPIFIIYGPISQMLKLCLYLPSKPTDGLEDPNKSLKSNILPFKFILHGTLFNNNYFNCFTGILYLLRQP